MATVGVGGRNLDVVFEGDTYFDLFVGGFGAEDVAEGGVVRRGYRKEGYRGVGWERAQRQRSGKVWGANMYGCDVIEVVHRNDHHIVHKMNRSIVIHGSFMGMYR